MTRVVFVTTEMSPWVPGGAGAVVAGIRDRLLADGDQVTVLLVAQTDAALPKGVRAVGVATGFEASSRAAAEALAEEVGAGDLPDLIEFQDFDGLAFHALAHRAATGIDRIPVQVRFHGPADLMFEAIGVEPPEASTARSMERSAYQMADRVVVPSMGIERLVEERYRIDGDRILVGQPPVLRPQPLELHPAHAPLIVGFGRLGEVKGSHDLVTAAVPVLRERSDLRLVLIGEDGWSATAGRPMQEWLEAEVIPGDVADRIEFTGRLEGDALDRRLAQAWAVVIPSRFESFSLAAHEARGAGLPVIVPDLPAFDGILDEATGALVYDGSSDGLTAALRRVIEDADLRHRLATAPVPTYSDPLGPYRDAAKVRHPRSQAGLATAAVQNLEAERADTPPAAYRGRGQGVLRFVPAPVARAAVLILPQWAKDRFRPVADWRREQERRAEVEREAAVQDRVAAGEFAELDRPQVSIVIPCYNQGRFLDGAIRSVFEQTMDSFEVIVVDDGSTDPETALVIDGLDWPRTRVIRQENQGLAAARNTGMGHARGEFVVPLDADDELAPEFLDRLIAELDANPKAAFASCWARLFGDIDAVWATRRYNPYQLLLSNSVVGCVLLRHAAWNEVGGYDVTMGNGNEDWELWVRLMEAGWEAVDVHEPLFRYRKHGVTMSVETEARFEEGRKAIVDRHPDLFSQERLSALKRAHYPLLSILVPEGAEQGLPPDQDLTDAEVGAVGEILDDAVKAARGKYVVHWAGVTGSEPGTLSRLADFLEEHPDVGGAATNDDRPIVLVRRWSLSDPDAPTHIDALDIAGSGRDQLAPGAFPDPAWMVPEIIDEVPVQRQPPEEEGRLPTWAAT
jgi:glycosyltransferase involved in cell wall biosynthesis